MINSDGTRPQRPMVALPLSFLLLAVAVVCLSFLIYIERPEFLAGDTGYLAFGALQYVRGEVGKFHAVSLVNPRDLSANVECGLVTWSPGWTLLFVIAFKLGLRVGPAAKLLEFLISICGAIGWVWVARILGLKRLWCIAAVILASLYCLRADIVTESGPTDPIVYAVAPWLIGAAICLLRSDLRSDWRFISRFALLSAAVASVYWLKYSAIFFAIAVFAAMILEHFRSFKSGIRSSIAIAALYCAAFVLPIGLEKAYNYSRTGSDLIETSRASGRRASPPGLARGLIEETLYDSSEILFAAARGADRVLRDRPPQFHEGRLAYLPIHWLVRLPGLCLLLFFLWLVVRYSERFIRDLGILLVLITVVGFPALSFYSGTRFVSAIERCSEPSWIFIELLIFAILSEKRPAGVHFARIGLALAVAVQLLLFCYIPLSAVIGARAEAHRPAYESGPQGVKVIDFSSTNSRSVIEEVSALAADPSDVIVPATRNLGMDAWLELDGHRLLPLTTFWAPVAQSQGADGANYYGRKPFNTSHPLRVILVACDPYQDSDFQTSLERIRNRFPQASSWTRQPAPAGSNVEIWTANLNSTPPPPNQNPSR